MRVGEQENNESTTLVGLSRSQHPTEMITFSTLLLPIRPLDTTKEKLEILSAIKNAVIGHVERKQIILSHPGLNR